MIHHHIIIPTSLEKEFAEKLSSKRLTRYRQCLNWHVVPAQEVYLLCLEQLGYLIMADKDDLLEYLIVGEIDYLEPEGAVASIDPDPDNITWGMLPEYPRQIRKRINQGLSTLKKCPNLEEAEDEIVQLNHKPVTIMDRTFTPMEGLTGFINELQACYEHYHEKTGALRMLWNALTGKTPWADPDYEIRRE